MTNDLRVKMFATLLFKTDSFRDVWLTRSIPALDRLTPLEYANKHGFEALFDKIMHGLYADSV